MSDGVKELVARVAAGEMRALARAISVVEEDGAAAAAVIAACQSVGVRAKRIGVTGPPGAGKSTLIAAMVRWLRAQGHAVGVIMVDPTSPLTGGALLGDRIRMHGFTGDEGVYLRSMASRGESGGLAAGLEGVCAVMEASGRGTVLIETVGTGQAEVAIAALADLTVLVLMPGMGDDIQALKAGVMEVADVIVVNKGDLPGAMRVEEEIQGVQSLVAGGGVPVFRTTAAEGEGVGALMETLTEMVGRRKVDDSGMRLLLINVCGSEGIVAVADEGGVLGEMCLDGRSASEGLLGTIRQLFAEVGWAARELTGVGVVVGPGSFTGVRVGLSTAKGICDAAGCGLVAMSRLRLVGRVAMLDAGRGEYFLGDAGGGERIVRAPAPIGAVTCEQRVAEALGIGLVREPDGAWMLTEMLLRIRAGEWSDVERADANYLRRTDAEILVNGA